MNTNDFILGKISDYNINLTGPLIKKFKNSKKILYSSVNEIAPFLYQEKIKEEIILKFLEKRQEFLDNQKIYLDKIHFEVNDLKRNFGIYIISFSDNNYPKQLKHIQNIPLNLYTKGDINFDYSKSIAIVGSRNISSYAREKISEISKDLSKKGFCIISGLALGADGQAQSSAVANGGKTIAVMPFLSDKIYPKENTQLARDILFNNGALISEKMLFDKVYDPFLFKDRNRLISGLSRAILIVEGSNKSGSLSQYNHAKRQNKIIFTLKPIKEYAGSYLPEKIINDGGFAIESATEILNVLNGKIIGKQTKLV